MNRRSRRNGLCIVLIALATAVFLVPMAVLWLIGSTERRLWVISGPPPFCYLGSGPLLVWIGVGALGLGSALLYAAVQIMGRKP